MRGDKGHQCRTKRLSLDEKGIAIDQCPQIDEVLRSVGHDGSLKGRLSHQRGLKLRRLQIEELGLLQEERGRCRPSSSGLYS